MLKRLMIAAAAALCIGATEADAQAVHLRPIFRRDIHHERAVLTLVRQATTTALPDSAWFQLDGDNLLVSTGKGIDRILLKGRTMSDVVHEIRTRYDVDVRTPYPSHPASVLGRTDKPASFTGNAVAFTAAPASPVAELGFGLVLGLNADSDEGEGILSQAGFQLDVVGTHELRSPSADSVSRWRVPFSRSQVFAQIRLGLSSDQQLVTREDSLEAPPAGLEFESAVRQADQIALTGQLDFVWSVRKRTEFGVTAGFGVNWTQPERFHMPSISVRDTLRAAEEVFGADRVDALTRRLNSSSVHSETSVLGTFRFHNGRELSYYAGGGVLLREILRRGFAFRRGTDMQPDSTSLRPLLDGEGEWFWQAVFGVTVPGVGDIRLDGVGPIRRVIDKPVLRLVIARDFPVRD